MALHFVFNATFVHNHIIDGESISHAHPFTGQEHDSGEAKLIQLFNTTTALSATPLELPSVHFSFIEHTPQYYCCSYTSGSKYSLALRGPPALF